MSAAGFFMALEQIDDCSWMYQKRGSALQIGTRQENGWRSKNIEASSQEMTLYLGLKSDEKNLSLSLFLIRISMLNQRRLNFKLIFL